MIEKERPTKPNRATAIALTGALAGTGGVSFTLFERMAQAEAQIHNVISEIRQLSDDTKAGFRDSRTDTKDVTAQLSEVKERIAAICVRVACR